MAIETLAGISMLSGLIGGAGQMLGGIVGGGARRREQRAARREYSKYMQEFENMRFDNPYEDLQNPFENLTVNQQEARFLAEQQQQSLANTMGSLRGAAGGSGVASLAQAMANQQNINLQKIAASIGQQEARNQAMAAKGAMQVQMAEAQGEQYVQEREFGRTSTMLGMSQQRLAAANMARQQATQQLVGGIGSIASAGLMYGASQGAFGENIAGIFNKN